MFRADSEKYWTVCPCSVIRCSRKTRERLAACGAHQRGRLPVVLTREAGSLWCSPERPGSLWCSLERGWLPVVLTREAGSLWCSLERLAPCGAHQRGRLPVVLTREARLPVVLTRERLAPCGAHQRGRLPVMLTREAGCLWCLPERMEWTLKGWSREMATPTALT